MGWLKAMNVPQRTLRRLADEKYDSLEEAASCKHERFPIFNVKLEKEFVHYCFVME